MKSMKKILSLMTALLLVVCTLPASAESMKILEASDRYDMAVNVPENTVVEQNIVNGELSMIIMTLPDETKPTYCMSIAYDELFDDASLCDMTEDDINSLYEYITTGFDEPGYELKKLDPDVSVILLHEEGVSDYGYALTIMHGYIISIYIFHEDYAPLTDDDYTVAVELLDNFEMTEVTK